jgi:hypothetical protein
MAVYLGRLLTAVKDLELAGKTIPDDEVAYQILKIARPLRQRRYAVIPVT